MRQDKNKEREWRGLAGSTMEDANSTRWYYHPFPHTSRHQINPFDMGGSGLSALGRDGIQVRCLLVVGRADVPPTLAILDKLELVSY